MPRVIAIGASAGGLEALQQLGAALPADLPAAVLITLHLRRATNSPLPAMLNRVSAMPAAEAQDREWLQAGRIYTAPSDYHFSFHGEQIALSHGPAENMQRPCINVMFRSAAAVFGPRAIGVLLTGLLDDGAAGLWEIQQRGGVAIVQDPQEALFRSMPDSAIRGLNVPYILKLAEIPPLLQWLTAQEMPPVSESYVEPTLVPTAQACPACGGAMAAAHLGGLREYRCHIGHRFGLSSLVAEKRRIVEAALESALAQTEELTSLLELSIAEQPETPEADQLRNELATHKIRREALRARLQLQSSPVPQAAADCQSGS